jgi:hypothetical protein
MSTLPLLNSRASSHCLFLLQERKKVRRREQEKKKKERKKVLELKMVFIATN